MTLKVLFVCLGNICRSPTAEGVLRQRLQQRGLAGQVTVDSAGTEAWHRGKAPDQRSAAAAARRGYDLSPLRARQVHTDDFDTFDYVLAMDSDNLRNLQALQPPQARTRPQLFLQRFAQRFHCHDVPDPYYGGEQGFEQVLDLLEDACDGLLLELEQRLQEQP